MCIPTIKAIKMKSKNHPSILMINVKMEADSSFNFHALSDEDMEKATIITLLNPFKLITYHQRT